MKTNKYIKAIFAGALVVSAAACDENSWNDDLKGFDDIVNAPVSDVRTVEYTLTDNNYEKIASNSTNKSLAGDEGKAALAAVGSLKRFSAEAPASKYVPAFLSSTDFPYFTLTDGSAVKLTYNQANAEPAQFVAAQTVQSYAVTNEQYENDVWGSENFVNAFAPSHQPADYLPAILAANLDASNGTYAVVSYLMANQEPVFGDNAPAEPEEVFAASLTDEDVYNTFTVEDTTLPEGLSRVWSWGGANYGAKATANAGGTNYAAESWLISPAIDLTKYTAPTLTYEQATNYFSSVDVLPQEATAWVREVGGQWVKLNPEYPEKLSWTFVSAGTLDLSDFAGKKVQIGFCYKSDAKAGTWEVKNVSLIATPASRASRASVSVPTTSCNAVYAYASGKWAVAKGFAVLQPADYKAMGQNYPNLPAAEPYLSKYLNVNYPYAAEDDVKYVYWTRYASGSSSIVCSAYRYNGTEWIADNFVTTETTQFVRTGGKWLYDPNVTINLPAGKGQEMSTLYFQACVNWVYDNICVPLGDTSIKSGKFYVSSYGNNEYYSGTSAYQGNIDIRYSAARAQYAAGYEGMSDEQVVEAMKTRFMKEVMPGALSTLHPDAKPIEGLDVLYTINFYTYDEDRKTLPHTAVFRVTGPAKFAPVSCTWWEGGKIPE